MATKKNKVRSPEALKGKKVSPLPRPDILGGVESVHRHTLGCCNEPGECFACRH